MNDDKKEVKILHVVGPLGESTCPKCGGESEKQGSWDDGPLYWQCEDEDCVALEEWDELRQAIRANKIEAVREEAIDLAAVCIRFARQCRSNRDLIKRSQK